MAKINSVFLDQGDKFPEMELKLLSGETIRLPEATGEGYGIVLFYRGYWWPFCSQQLADFQSLIKEFEAEQIKVIAGSVDSLEHTKGFVEKLGIRYPVAYGLDAEEVSRVTGAYYEKERKFTHPAGFLVRPDKTIEVSCYSSGPIGRFVAQDVLRVIQFLKSRK